MTVNNRAYELNPSTLKLNYTQLTILELEFVNILFERIEPLYLNDINYPTFKFTALQKCPEELEELIHAENSKQTGTFIA